MAQQAADLYGETFSCSICLNRLKEPVTIPCGHSYCKTCISRFWDRDVMKNSYSCPQCRKVFRQRPDLEKNTLIAEVVEKLNKSELHDASGVESYATAEDVACDSCTGRKLKASKSCLVCLTSYCEIHLQPHHESAFKRHKLVDPSEKIQEMICPLHDEVRKIFCRTDGQCICFLCSLDKHKGHDTVLSAAETAEKKRELQESRADIQKNIPDREKDVDLLKQQEKIINVSPNQIRVTFNDMISLVQRRSSVLMNEVRSKKETELSAVRALREKLENQISELKKRDAELQQISTIEDHIQFVLSYSSLSALSVSTHSNILTHPENSFKKVTEAVSKLSEYLHKVLMKDWTNFCHTVEILDALLMPEPTSRAGFLVYLKEITLDPTTACNQLSLSERNRKVTQMRTNQDHPPHPDRFTGQCQVLSTESVTGCCYWEVEWTGMEVHVAAAYKSISRAGDECEFGNNNKSWSLLCTPDNYTFNHNQIRFAVPGPQSSKIGVYVDHTGRILSFYSVDQTMTLLHRVNTTFTEPLHLGIRTSTLDGTAKLCTL